MESITPKEKKETQKIDRVVLDKESVLAIQNVTTQINLRLGDLIEVSQKEVANFLIQKRSQELNDQELELLRIEYFDMVKALKRAQLMAIKAKQNGTEINADEVLKIIQTPSVNLKSTSGKPRGRKKGVNSEPDAGKNNTATVDHANALKPVKNVSSKNSNLDTNLGNSQASTSLIAP